MKKIALDTNIVIDVLNGRADSIAAIGNYDIYYLPITVVGELLFGAKNSGKKQENLKALYQFIDKCKELTVDKLVAEEYSSIRFQLKKQGTPIPENDIWIAASCKVNHLPLITRDKHFSNIRGLQLETV